MMTREADRNLGGTSSSSVDASVYSSIKGGCVVRLKDALGRAMPAFVASEIAPGGTLLKGTNRRLSLKNKNVKESN